MNDRPIPARAPAQRPGRYLGPIRLTVPLVVVVVVLIGSVIFDAWVVLTITDGQIPLLAVGLVVTGGSLGAIAIGALVGMWRAASRAAGGRSFALALVGGLAGLAAIGCFAITALLVLVWNT
ncbi:MAG: hypothetical protein HYX55_09275 [Chloroflexi bacterium]|nr:hypothetical protein [Chloroflexota bacterium]